jgi:Protein of unknown function (DUF2939)
MKRAGCLMLLMVALPFGLFWARNSPYYALYRINAGLQNHDTEALADWVDFEGFAQVPAQLAQEKVRKETENTPAVVQLLAGAVAQLMGLASRVSASPITAVLLKRAISTQTLGDFTFGFQLQKTPWWYGGFESKTESLKWLTLHGHCPLRMPAGQTAKLGEQDLVLTFEAHRGFFFGYPVNWRATGIETASAVHFIEHCQVF